MATRNLNYNVNARINAEGLDKFTRELQKADRIIEKMGNTDNKSQLSQLQKKFERETSEVKNLAQAYGRLDKAVKSATEGRFKNISALNKAVSSGGPTTSVRNAELQGEKNRLRARTDNQFAEITNTVVRNMKQFTQALGNAAVRELAEQRQRVQSGDTRADLDQRIQAQEFRASQAAFGVSPNTGKALSGSAQQKSYAAEQKALDELRQGREQLVQQEKEQERVQRRRASLQDQFTKKLREAQAARARGSQRDRVAADIKAQELRLQKALVESGNERTQQVRRLESQLGRLKETQQGLVNTEKKETEEAREQLKLNERIARTTSRQNAQERAGRTLGAQDQTIAGYRQMIDSELKRTGGQRTDMVERLEQRLTKELRLRDQIQQEQKESTQLERKRLNLQQQIENAVRDENRAEAAGQEKERIGAQIKRKQLEIDQARLRTNNKITAEIKQQERELADLKKQQRDARIKEDREFTQDRLFGDKGAGLFAIQAQLAGNFLVMDQMFNLVQFGTQFVLQLDQAFKQLQAITDTTQTEMQSLRKELIKVSERTKFTAVDVAEAATTLGQAGFSTRQIKESIESITLLATAVGSTLQQAVDLATSTIKVFNLQASEMANVADTFTAAVNNSKLTLDKLTLGIQYAGNIASQTGVKFQELTAALGAMANSGIRSGSMLGTGLRRLLISFQSPKDKLTDRLRQLGLTAQDVNVQVNGLVGVMNNLQEAGFDVSDAMDTMRIRAGSAFAALSNNIQTVTELRQIFTLTNAAAEANARQMQGLSNKLSRLKSIFGSFIDSAGKPFIQMLKGATDALSSMFQALNKIGPTIGVIGTALTTFFTTLLVTRIAAMAANFLKLGTAMRAAAAGARSLTAGTVTLTGAIRGLFSSTGIGLILTGISTVTAGMYAWNRSTDEAGDKLDKLQAKVDKTEGRLEKKRQTVDSVNKEIDRLIDRYQHLEGEQNQLTTVALELQQKFGSLGAQFDASGGKVQNFINELVRLREEMKRTARVDLENLISQKGLTALQQFRQAANQSNLGTKSGKEFANNLFSAFKDQFPDVYHQVVRDLTQSNNTLPDFGGQGYREGTFFRKMVKQNNQIPEEARQAILGGYDRSTSGFSANGNRIATGISEDDALETSRQIDARLSELRRVQQRIIRGDQRFDDLPQETLESLQTVIDALKQRLNGVKSNLLGAAKNLKQQNRAVFEDEVAEFEQTDAYKAQRDLVTQLDRYLGRLREERKKADTPDEQSFLQDKIRTVQDRLETIQQNLIEAAIQEMDVDEREARRIVSSTGAFNKKNDLIGDSKQFYQKIDEVRAETIKKQGNAILEKLRQQADNLASKVNENRSVEEVQALENEFIENQRKQREIQIKQRIQELRENGDVNTRGSLNTVFRRVMEGNLTGFNKTATLQMENFLDETASQIEEETRSTFSEFYETINEAGKDLEKSLKRYAKSISNITSNLEEEKQRNRFGVNRAELRAEYASSREGENKFSDVRRTQLEERVREAKTQAIRDDIPDIKQGLQRAEDLRQEIQNEKQRLRNDIEEARETRFDPSAAAGKRAEARQEIIDKEKDLNRLNRESIKLRETQRQIERDLVTTRQKLAARTGNLKVAQMSMGETLSAAVRQWQRESGSLQSTTQLVGNNIKDVFREASNSFGQFTNDVLTGSKDIEGAFRSMATSIVGSMMEIASNALAKKALGFLVGNLMGGAGATQTPGFEASSVSSGASGNFNFAAGGSVKRAAAGTAVNTRDSTPILAQPGEYVLRKSAVSAIGRENLEAINRAGNTQMSRSAPPRVAPRQGQNDGEGETFNIYVVTPDQQPPPGEKDIIATVDQNIARGGSTKKLIKQVNTGRL